LQNCFTIGGYNCFLRKQHKEEGAAQVTTVLFDHDYELLHDAVDLQAVNPITAAEYFVRGNTALLDAVGRTSGRVNARADKAIFVSITDGFENANVEFNYARVREMIAGRMAAFAKGRTAAMYDPMSQNVSEIRKGKQMPQDWDKGIKGDDKLD